MGVVNPSVRAALATKSDNELWVLFLSHGEDFGIEFWEEGRARQDAGTLDKASPFWTTAVPAIKNPTQEGKIITLNSEEWFSRQREVVSRIFGRRRSNH